MPAMNEGVVALANRLYWEGDASVAQIAEQLGVSRRALYAMLRPEPAGGRCPDCGAGLVYPTRSARSAGTASCPGCGRAEGDRGGAAGEPAQPPADLPEEEPQVEQELAAGRLAPIGTSGAVLRTRVLFIGSAALAGVAVGATLVLLASRRR